MNSLNGAWSVLLVDIGVQRRVSTMVNLTGGWDLSCLFRTYNHYLDIFCEKDLINFSQYDASLSFGTK